MITNNHLSVCLTSELRLEQALKEAGIEDPACVSKLTISGMLTKEDFGHIRRNMAETLKELDMSGAVIEENTIKTWAFNSCTGLTSVALPEGVTTIGNTAFEDCAALASINIPESVTTIECCAFSRSGLTAVKIPAGAVSVRFCAFYCCKKLQAIVVDERNTNYCSVDGVLFNKEKTTIIAYPAGRQGGFAIPDGVTTIGVWAFIHCAGLTSMHIPEGVVNINEGAFEGCVGLTSVIIPDSVLSIDCSAFRRCSNLTSVTIGKNVKSISCHVFSGCTELTSITIPASVTEINNNCVFYNCSKLAAIEVAKGNTKFSSVDGVLFNKRKSKLIYYPEGKQGAYNIPSSVKYIDNNVFINCSVLTSVRIHDRIKTIHGFYGCAALTSVYIGSGATSIRASFFGCSSLVDIEVAEENVKYSSVNGALFDKSKSRLFRCPEGKQGAYTIPDGVTEIRAGAFTGCARLSAVRLPESLTHIPEKAFVGCSGLTVVSIPAKVEYIGRYSFAKCAGLATIEVAADNPNYSSVNGVLFNKDKTILITYPEGKPETSYIVPDCVTSFGEGAFYGCAALNSVTIPDHMTVIRDGMFECCTGLTSIIIPDGVSVIEYCAFMDCTGLTSVTIPAGVISIGKRAFWGCNALSSITCRRPEPPEISLGFFDEPFPYLPDCRLYVPQEGIHLYQAAKGWKDFVCIAM